MAESPLFDLPPQTGVLCDRCGRVFERGGMVTARDGTTVILRPHSKGDPKECIPVPGSVVDRDARRRRANRRGR